MDASDGRWGDVLLVLGDSPEGVARGVWSPAELHMHINQKEMRAVRYALHAFESVLSNRVVRLHEDNTATQAVLGRFAPRSHALMQEYRLLWHVLEQLHIQL